jgi:hypothetical protein
VNQVFDATHVLDNFSGCALKAVEKGANSVKINKTLKINQSPADNLG